MIHFDLPKQKSSIIKVLGVGGGGSNAVNYMYAQNIEGVDFVICNTDAKALEQSRIPNKIQLGPHLTQGLGAGANPEVGKQATEESLEEIRKILEVNTKMAFITAGMGGGTGTGGAPIISRICRELGILTVGIVTTPFAFEGPRRLKSAEEGIRQMQPYVDTLLVISNDKLRMQYGNLKMTEAFGKADNVLATAAKCITDIINSKGTIIVDFADVCTVMKNGGVAILGSATAEGENRAISAIEEALNSPLLNDNDIRGAKWILVNIVSGVAENECTMDEFEVINDYLRTQSGGNTDLIIGTGHDTSLGNKIAITLIATGFEYKDPFSKKEEPVVEKQAPVEEKIVMTLGVDGEEKKMYNQQPLPFVEKDPYAPKMVEEQPEQSKRVSPVFFIEPTTQQEEPKKKEVGESNEPVHFELFVPKEEPVKKAEKIEKVKAETKPEELQMKYVERETAAKKETPVQQKVSAGFLNKPKNIYAEVSSVEQQVASTQAPPYVQPVQELAKETSTVTHLQPVTQTQLYVQPPVQEPVMKASTSTHQQPATQTQPYVQQPVQEPVMKTSTVTHQPAVTQTQPYVQQPVEDISKTSAVQPQSQVVSLQPDKEKEPEQKIFLKEEPLPEDNTDFKLVIKEEEPPKKQIMMPIDPSLDDLLNNEEEEQKRRAAERISKLRNLSFNMNSSEGGAEYDNVPAYVRRNMELFGNTLTSVEQFYSKYTVKKDENDETQISTINTFLDGKKPD
jgi:cell division protein FtsZ